MFLWIVGHVAYLFVNNRPPDSIVTVEGLCRWVARIMLDNNTTFNSLLWLPINLRRIREVRPVYMVFRKVVPKKLHTWNVGGPTNNMYCMRRSKADISTSKLLIYAMRSTQRAPLYVWPTLQPQRATYKVSTGK